MGEDGGIEDAAGNRGGAVVSASGAGEREGAGAGFVEVARAAGLSDSAEREEGVGRGREGRVASERGGAERDAAGARGGEGTAGDVERVRADREGAERVRETGPRGEAVGRERGVGGDGGVAGEGEGGVVGEREVAAVERERGGAGAEGVGGGRGDQRASRDGNGAGKRVGAGERPCAATGFGEATRAADDAAEHAAGAGAGEGEEVAGVGEGSGKREAAGVGKLLSGAEGERGADGFEATGSAVGDTAAAKGEGARAGKRDDAGAGEGQAVHTAAGGEDGLVRGHAAEFCDVRDEVVGGSGAAPIGGSCKVRTDVGPDDHARVGWAQQGEQPKPGGPKNGGERRDPQGEREN